MECLDSQCISAEKFCIQFDGMNKHSVKGSNLLYTSYAHYVFNIV